MPDPILSSSVPPSASDVMCKYEDDPSLMSMGPTAPVAATQTPTRNSSEPPVPSVDPPVSNVPSGLVQKFPRHDHSALIATTQTTSELHGVVSLTRRPDQLDVRAGLPRLESHDTFGDLHVTSSIDKYNFSAHLGSLNEDGSHGENIGTAANLVSGEVTLDYHGWSLSAGVGVSLGFSIASGEGRDLDADGVPERCFKMSLGYFTLGECDEL